ncbi:hypothetical protein D3C85_1719790 [compost metagenome]
MLVFVEIIYETKFVKAPNRHLDYLLPVGHHNIFLGDKVRQILLDRLPDLLLMTLLILIAFAVKRPVLA